MPIVKPKTFTVRKQIFRKGDLPMGTDVFLILKRYKVETGLSMLEIGTGGNGHLGISCPLNIFLSLISQQ